MLDFSELKTRACTQTCTSVHTDTQTCTLNLWCHVFMPVRPQWFNAGLARTPVSRRLFSYHFPYQASISRIDLLHYGISVSFGSIAHDFNCLNYIYSFSVTHCCQTAKRSLVCVDSVQRSDPAALCFWPADRRMNS